MVNYMIEVTHMIQWAGDGTGMRMEVNSNSSSNGRTGYLGYNTGDGRLFI